MTEKPDKEISSEEKEKVIEDYMKNFYREAWFKVIENLVSAKMWGYYIFLGISTYLLFKGKIDGSQWTWGNVTVHTTIYGIREIFKIEKIKRIGAEFIKRFHT